MNDSIISETPAKKRYKQTDEGAALQAAREDAGLSRENLSSRLLLARREMGRGWFCSDEVMIASEAQWIKKLERARTGTFPPTTLATLLTLIDAGPLETSDDDVLEYWREHLRDQKADEVRTLKEIGATCAKALLRDIESTEADIASFIAVYNQSYGEPLHRYLDDPRYIKDPENIVIASALEYLVNAVLNRR